ncbi:MAG TPA: MBOAT family protein [Patescibacteria group bacterium]|nr:MBOAT family protein [Patescibacteria group bacterium]
MVFSSVVFLFYFLPLFFLAFYLFGRSKGVLLAFSLVFYAWGEPTYILLMLLSIGMNHQFGLAIEKAHATGRDRMWLSLGIAANLAPLVLFKYSTFLVGIFTQDLFSLFGKAPLLVKVPHLVLPLGISFYTFHALSYLIDVYRKDVKAERSLRDLTVYISMFPQLVAGPIIRYKTIAGELHHPVMSTHRTARGIRIFVIGLAQKVLIANTVAASADAIFALPAEHLTTPLAWLGISCYTLQIYFDFGGYSSMAIGLGLMIGFTFPLNFRYPYVARSMTDFWRRWHISLSSWFRDYLYIPLGGNRVSPWRTYVNLFVVFLLCGIWHGAAWTFVVWGLLHGGYLVIERLGMGRLLERLPVVLRHAYVLLCVMVAWVFFRADSLDQALHYLKAMAGFGASAVAAPLMSRYLGLDVMLAIAAGLLAAGPHGAAIAVWVGDRLSVGRLRLGPSLGLVGLMGLLLLATMSLAGGAYNPFIYFRF